MLKFPIFEGVVEHVGLFIDGFATLIAKSINKPYKPIITQLVSIIIVKLQIYIDSTEN
jgi:hypothetical protein